MKTHISLWTWGEARARYVAYSLWIIMYYSEWITQHSLLFRVRLNYFLLFTLNNMTKRCVIDSEYYMIIQSEYATWHALGYLHVRNEKWVFVWTWPYIYIYIYIYIERERERRGYSIVNHNKSVYLWTKS